MDANAVIQAIGSVGFPIVMCLIMALYIKYTNDKHTEQIKELNAQHTEEVKNMVTSIDNNTKVIQELTLYIKEGNPG